ncbi:CAP domain-containing protein [Patescibacteria group bacterium]|nr:CAP domain-containing protein [Patescibacteria group bacterium]
MFGRVFKKYFIPHEGNDHRPHILRSGAFLGMLLAILFVETLFVARSFFLFPNIDLLASILPSILVSDTNANRTADALHPLRTSALLTEAAQLKANDMAAKGYFSHVSPNGETPWYWLDQVGYNYEYAGENLAVNFTDSNDVVNAWMNSPEHRANILDGRYTQIGIATAQGDYQGHPAIFVVQFFGQPAPQASVAVAAPAAAAGNPAPESPTSAAAAEPAVAGAASVPQNAPAVPPPSFTATVVAEPHALTNYFYLILFAVVGTALTLYVIIKREARHPQLILNGLTVLLLVLLTVFVNNLIAVYQAAIL